MGKKKYPESCFFGFCSLENQAENSRLQGLEKPTSWPKEKGTETSRVLGQCSCTAEYRYN